MPRRGARRLLPPSVSFPLLSLSIPGCLSLFLVALSPLSPSLLLSWFLSLSPCLPPPFPLSLPGSNDVTGDGEAQVGKRDGKGRTCLHHAALLDHGRCTEVLLMHGASADVRDDMGETALEVAAHAPRAQAFEAIVRSKGLRMAGKEGKGFPGSGSDPEDNAQSPRSASPPLAKGPASPELHRLEDPRSVSSLQHPPAAAPPAAQAAGLMRDALSLSRVKPHDREPATTRESCVCVCVCVVGILCACV